MADTANCPPAVKVGVPIVVVIAIILTIILCVASLSVLQPNQVGFVFDQNTQTIKLDQLYGPGGRHFIGLGKRFVTYPTKLLLLEFSEKRGADAPPISVFTKDGQTVVITCSVMVSLKKDELDDLYKLYGENKYTPNFIRIGVTAIRNTAAERFNKEDYFLNRPAVGAAFRAAVEKEYSNIHGTVSFFQLRRIDLPASLEAEISKNIVTSQQSKTSQAQQTATLIRKQTQVEIAAGDLILNQMQTAAAINNTNAILVANAQAKEILLKAEANALAGARDMFGLAANESSVLLNWLYQRTLQNLNNTDMWIGFTSFTQTLPIN